MFERISRGMELTAQSMRVLREEKSLVIFPLLSSIAGLMVLASFGLPLWFSGYIELLSDNGRLPQDPVAYVILFAFYFVNYFVIVFFNSALISCALMRFRGENPTVGDGFRAAISRLPQIVAWALLSATVGVLLKAIESRSRAAGDFVAGLLGAAWSIATFFVVPVLVVERLGPIAAVQRSFAILRRTWGESLVSQVGIGFAVFLAILVALVPAVLGLVLGTVTSVTIGVAITVALVLLISLISAALHTIILAALYLYAAEGQVPLQFDRRLLEQAYSPKR